MEGDVVPLPGSGPEIRLISVILSPERYPDRFRLLFELGKHVGRHVILTRDPIEVPEGAVRTELYHNGGRFTGPRHWWWAFRTASRIVRESPAGPWIVNEHQVGLTALLLRARFPRRIRVIVSGYSAEITLLVRHRWTDDPHRGDITLGQHLRYVRGGLRKVPIQIVSRLPAHLIVGNSRQVIDDVRLLFPWKQTSVVPSTVDLEHFSPPARHREWGGRAGEVELLYVGDLRLFKGLGTLLAALRIVRLEGVPARLTLVGGAYPEDRDWLRVRLHETGVDEHVDLTGTLDRPELVERYRRSDLFVFASFHEGSPRVVKEALACGCPVVCSDIPGARVLDPEGEVLRYFAPGHARGLANRVLELLGGNRRSTVGRTARQFAERFGAEEIASRYARIYSDLYANASPRLRPHAPETERDARVRETENPCSSKSSDTGP